MNTTTLPSLKSYPTVVTVSSSLPVMAGDWSDMGDQYVHALTMQFWLDSMNDAYPDYFGNGQYMDERVDNCRWLEQLWEKGYRHPVDSPKFIFKP